MLNEATTTRPIAGRAARAADRSAEEVEGTSSGQQALVQAAGPPASPAIGAQVDQRSASGTGRLEGRGQVR